MAGKNGGYRPGSGRKPKMQKYASAINAAERQIKDNLPEIVTAHIALAKGVKTVSEDGVIYTTLPDRNAGQYLMNRIMGSPIQRSEFEGTIDRIHLVYDDVEPAEDAQGDDSELEDEEDL